jgi:hypothetical protein
VADVLSNLATLSEIRGDLDVGVERALRGIELARDLGYRWAEAHCLCALVPLVFQQGDLAAAREYATEGLAIYEDIGHRWGASDCMDILIRIDLAAGDLDAAEARANDRLGIVRDLEDRRAEVETWTLLGRVALGRGDLEAATRHGARCSSSPSTPTRRWERAERQPPRTASSRPSARRSVTPLGPRATAAARRTCREGVRILPAAGQQIQVLDRMNRSFGGGVSHRPIYCRR